MTRVLSTSEMMRQISQFDCFFFKVIEEQLKNGLSVVST